MEGVVTLEFLKFMFKKSLPVEFFYLHLKCLSCREHKGGLNFQKYIQ